MECTLMHKNIPVVEIAISENTGGIEQYGTVYNPAHIPLGTTSNARKDKDRIITSALNKWWTGRCIPASRDGIREALDALKIPSTVMLLSKCYGLSLSDQYWVCPKDTGLKWEDINIFQNDFSKDIGEILFGHEPEDSANISLLSPNNTSDGVLRKKWIIADGKRFLMKGGSGVFHQQPFNEVIACSVMRRLGIPHILYTLTEEKGKHYSLCENFITPDTELVPARRVSDAFHQENHHSDYTHLLHCCETLGIPDVEGALGKMLLLDYIIANEDRHQNNFGFIRNAETLEWLGLAPVFDSGTSLWYNTPHVGEAVGCKPFYKDHGEQIKLVRDLSWFDPRTLDGLYDEIIDIFKPSDRMDAQRSRAIAERVMERAGGLNRNMNPL